MEKRLGVGAEQRPETGSRLGANRDLRLTDLAAEPAEEDLDERPAGKATIGVTGPFEPRHAVGACRRELGEEARLADAGRSGEQDDATAPRGEVAEDAVQQLELSLPTDHRRRCCARLALLRPMEL